MRIIQILGLAAAAWLLVIGLAFLIMAASRWSHGASIWPS
jgi:hypothetical protein